jgi:alkanesulfonate monooxygenase SsuD/methylene tetrahydromethanopterin reductase-like flavin-dependent oxidoreductase (luciferase family)
MIKFGLSLPLSYDIGKLIQLTQRAEQVGFDYVFMPDHVQSLDGSLPLNVWSVLTVLASSTHRVGLGSMVANVYRQHPSTLRQQVYTLQQTMKLHRDKDWLPRELIVGLGAGLVFDCKPYGIERTHPLRRVRESAEALIGLEVPTVIGAYGPNMKELASGWHGWVARHALSLPEFIKEKYEVQQHLGTEDKDYLYIADIPVSHMDEPWLWKTLAYRYLLQTKYRDKTIGASKFGIEKDSLTVPRSTLEGFSAVGTGDDIINKLSGYVVNGAKMFSIRYYGDTLEKFGDVMDYIRTSYSQ